MVLHCVLIANEILQGMFYAVIASTTWILLLTALPAWRLTITLTLTVKPVSLTMILSQTVHCVLTGDTIQLLAVHPVLIHSMIQLLTVNHVQTLFLIHWMAAYHV